MPFLLPNQQHQSTEYIFNTTNIMEFCSFIASTLAAVIFLFFLCGRDDKDDDGFAV